MKLIQEGSKASKIVLVGEAPGATEVKTGKPFSGASGEILNSILSRPLVDIRRSECFITNVCHIQPPGNNFNWFLKPTPKPELIMGLLQLKADLEEIKPNIVVCLGAVPLKFVTNKSGIDKWRGSLVQSHLTKGLKCIGTYHPAYCMRIWDYKAIAEIDFARVRSQSSRPELALPHRDFALNPSRDALLAIASELGAAPPGWLGVDIECWETPTGKWELSCVGFSDRPDRAFTIPWDKQWQKDAIKSFCESPWPKVTQNGVTFDREILREHGIDLGPILWDTMYGHHSLFPECAGGDDEFSATTGKKKQSAFKKGLAFQTSIYTLEPFYKDDGKLWAKTGDLEMFYRYNSLDAAVTREILDVQQRELKEFGTYDLALEATEQALAFTEITRHGIKIDMEWREQLTQEYLRQVSNLQAYLDKEAGGGFNVKSPNQIKSLLYDQLKLPVKISRKTKRPTVDKDAINALAGKYHHPLLNIILEIRQRRDFIERYLNAVVDSDGYMRCSLDVSGTRTGRLSSRQSIYGSGTNLQNIPARKPEGQAIRRMFIPDEGMVFVNRDYSQAEARIVAALARCDRLLALFADPNRDVHAENGARMFGRSDPKMVTFEERYQAKITVHATNYGMEEDHLVDVANEAFWSTGVRLDRKQARRLIDMYFMLYPEIKTVFWKEIRDQLNADRTLNTPFGRKRQFFGRWDDKLLRTAYAYIPQSVVGDLGRKALYGCYRELEVKEGICQVLLNVHDSVLVQCRPNQVTHVSNRMAELMKMPFTIHGREIIIPSDCKVGYNWQERPKKNPETNPKGLVPLEVWLNERDTTDSIQSRAS
jgi:DNA polymerase I - 3''-5'' exonuclease and polymerase domains